MGVVGARAKSMVLLVVYCIYDRCPERDREVVVVLQEQLEGEAHDELESLYLVKVEPRGRCARFQTPPLSTCHEVFCLFSRQ